jgi:molybdenum cofactor cytidylyltransferase
MAGNLRDALELRARDVVSIVGGGGKTTILYRLAQETVAAEQVAIVTGTTRFTPPERGERPPLVLNEAPSDLLAALRRELEASSVVVAGSGWGNQGRILPVEPDAVAAMRDIEGVGAVVVEADGSAGRPFKAPADHEPVIAAATTVLLSVVGIDVLGQPLAGFAVHRPEIVASLSGAAIGDPVTAEIIARVLLHERGGRKGLPVSARWVPVINKVDDEARLDAARRIAMLLRAGGASRVLITAAAQDPPLVELLR